MDDTHTILLREREEIAAATADGNEIVREKKQEYHMALRAKKNKKMRTGQASAGVVLKSST